MRLGTSLMALLLCLCSGHAEADGFSLNARELGEPVEGVLNDSRYECGGVSACFLYTVCTLKAPGTESLAGAALEGLSLHYGGKRLTAIEAQFSPDRFDPVLRDLVEEFGPTQSAPGGVRRDPTGPTGNVVYVWRNGSQLLRLERVSRDPARSSLIITQKSFLSELLGQ
jgi:hypothetical protein